MSSIYRGVINFADKFVPARLQPVWNHPAGYQVKMPADIYDPRQSFFGHQALNGFLIIMMCSFNFKSEWTSSQIEKITGALVIAGIGDMKRPAEKLSQTQSTALALTGCIWARYSMVIIPKNWSLFTVNVFVGLTGFYQLFRIYNHRKSLEAKESSST